MKNHTFYQIGIVLLMICFFFTQLGNENINLDKTDDVKKLRKQILFFLQQVAHQMRDLLKKLLLVLNLVW